MTQMVKNLPAMQETWVQPLSWQDPLEEGRATHSSILGLENPHAQRRLAENSPWSCKESDMTECLSTHTSERSHWYNLYILEKADFKILKQS